MNLKHGGESKLKTLGYALIGLAILLALLHIVFVSAAYYSDNETFTKISALFDLDNERNIPTVYTGLMLGCCAFISLLSVSMAKSLVERAVWLLMSGAYFYLAFDEILIVHETIARPVRQFFDISAGNVFYHAWVIPALGITLLVGGVTFFLKAKAGISQHQKNIILLTVILAASVISLEVIGTKLYFSPLIYKLGPVFVEEMLEIGMISLILYRLTGGFLLAPKGRRQPR